MGENAEAYGRLAFEKRERENRKRDKNRSAFDKNIEKYGFVFIKESNSIIEFSYKDEIYYLTLINNSYRKSKSKAKLKLSDIVTSKAGVRSTTPSGDLLASSLIEPTEKKTKPKIYQLNQSLITFGKYKTASITFEELLDIDESYFMWLLNSDTTSIELKKHLQLVLELNYELKIIQANSLIGFGKYANNSYEEVFEKDSDYFLWLCNTIKSESIKEHLKNILESKTNK